MKLIMKKFILHLFIYIKKKNKFYTKLESKDKIENDEEIIIINIL